MTITERNQKLYDLREKLLKKRTELAWIETEIMAVNQQYKDSQMGDLYEGMFGTVWEVAHRGLQLPPISSILLSSSQTASNHA